MRNLAIGQEIHIFAVHNLTKDLQPESINNAYNTITQTTQFLKTRQETGADTSTKKIYE